MIRLEGRRNIDDLIAEAHAADARLRPACEGAGIDLFTLQRWKSSDGLEVGDWRPLTERPTPV